MESVIYNIIGKRLKDIRLEKELTQEDIAKIIDSSKASVANYESGKQSIYISDIYKIALKLNVDIQRFLPTNDEVKEKLPKFIINSDTKLTKQEKASLEKFIKE